MFLQASLDLSSSTWTSTDLDLARSTFSDIFARVDPDWQSAPVGPLASYWQSRETDSFGHCIHVAQVVHEFSRTVSDRSIPILYRKIVELLRCPDNAKVYEERLAELEVGAYLGRCGAIVALEPLVPSSHIGSAAQPTSPDLAIKTQDGHIFFDVTTCYVRMLEDWDAVSQHVADHLSKVLSSAGLKRQVVLQLPISVEPADTAALVSKRTLRQVAAQAEGQLVIPLRRDRALIRWSSIVTYPSREAAARHVVSSLALVDASQTAFGSVVAIARQLTAELPPDLERRIYSSVRNTLKSKRKQLMVSERAVIVMRLGNEKLLWEPILELVAERIFGSPDFTWLSGLIAFTPQRSWTLGRNASSDLALLTNPLAAHQLTPQDIHLLQQGAATTGVAPEADG